MAFRKQAVAAPIIEKKQASLPEKKQEKTAPAAAKKAAPPTVKKENKLVRYFKEVRAELRKVVWPTRQAAFRLTAIVVGVTVAMSLFLGLLDFIFSRVFALVIGA